MNKRQRAHVDYFLERIEYWKGLERDYWVARMLAARDADHAHPLMGAPLIEAVPRAVLSLN